MTFVNGYFMVRSLYNGHEDMKSTFDFRNPSNTHGSLNALRRNGAWNDAFASVFWPRCGSF